MAIKSDFQDILKEDCKEYQALAKRYLYLNTEDVEEAYKIMKDAWSMAQRLYFLSNFVFKINNEINELCKKSI